MGQWQIVFFIAAFVYIICGTFYNLFGSGERQYWDNPAEDEQKEITNGSSSNNDATTSDLHFRANAAAITHITETNQ